MAWSPILVCISYAKSSTEAPYGSDCGSPLGVKTTMSLLYNESLKLSRNSSAFSEGLLSASRTFFSQRSRPSSSCVIEACLYFQCAAKPRSAMSSMRSVRTCTSTHVPSGPITVECSAS